MGRAPDAPVVAIGFQQSARCAVPAKIAAAAIDFPAGSGRKTARSRARDALVLSAVPKRTGGSVPRKVAPPTFHYKAGCGTRHLGLLQSQERWRAGIHGSS